MGWFFLSYLTVYGGMHAYAVWRVRQAWPQSRLALFIAIAWSLAMVLAPVITRHLDGAGHFGLNRIFSAIGFTWFVLIFWFFMAGLVLQMWNGATRLATVMGRPEAAALALSPRQALVVIAALLVVASVWGLIEGRTIGVRRVTISTDRLAPGSAPIRLVQLSDVHVNWYVRAPMLRRIADLVRAEKPDVIVSTGDLVDVSSRDAGPEAAVLDGLEAPLGKYAVTGNHEFYLSINDATRFHRQAGFQLLRGQTARTPDGRLAFVGVDDPAGRHMGVDVFPDETDYLPARAAPRPFTILLKHQPRVRQNALGRYDLQMSGHTHGGQVFPFYAFVRMVYRYGPGLHDLEQASRLFVSRGTGMWGPPMRLLARPEIVVFDLAPAQ